MPRNGTGSYSLPEAAFVFDTVIDETAVNANFSDIATALSNSIAKDGQTDPSANLPMASFRHTGVGNASARTHYGVVGQIQDGSYVWADAGGTADAITAAYSPAITALVDGMELRVRAGAANATTTPTFSPNGLTARTIVKTGGNALVAGDIAGDGHELILRYDLSNTRWELLNPADATVTRSDIGVANIRADGVLAPHHNLVLQNGSTAASQVDITADGLIVTDTSGNQVLLSSVSETADITTSGAGGLDTGSEANSTFYHAWIIYDGTNTDALLSTSTTFAGLTLPSGYTHAAYCGAMYNDGSGDFLSLEQKDRCATIPRTTDASNIDPASWTSVSVTAPTTAVKWVGYIRAENDGSNNAIIKVSCTTASLGRLLGGNASFSGSAFMPASVPLIEDQTIYILGDDATDIDVETAGWEF